MVWKDVLTTLLLMKEGTLLRFTCGRQWIIKLTFLFLLLLFPAPSAPAAVPDCAVPESASCTTGTVSADLSPAASASPRDSRSARGFLVSILWDPMIFSLSAFFVANKSKYINMHRSSRFEWDDYEITYLGLVQKPPSVRPPDVPRGLKYSCPWWPVDSAGSGYCKLPHSSHFFWRIFRIPPVRVHIVDAVDSNLLLPASFFELSSSAASLHLETAFCTSLSSRPPGRSRKGRGGATCPGCWSHRPPPAARGPCWCWWQQSAWGATRQSPVHACSPRWEHSMMRQLIINNMYWIKRFKVSIPEVGSVAVLTEARLDWRTGTTNPQEPRPLPAPSFPAALSWSGSSGNETLKR